MPQRVIKSKANAVVASLAKLSRPNENGQRDCAALGGGEKENLIPPMLLAGLISMATKTKKSARTLGDTKLEMEVISQCGSSGLDDYNPPRTNMARTQTTWVIPPGVTWRCSRQGNLREGT